MWGLGVLDQNMAQGFEEARDEVVKLSFSLVPVRWPETSRRICCLNVGRLGVCERFIGFRALQGAAKAYSISQSLLDKVQGGAPSSGVRRLTSAARAVESLRSLSAYTPEEQGALGPED